MQYAYQTPVAASLLTHLHERLLTTLQRCKAVKYVLHCFQSKTCLVWKYGMEYRKNFSMKGKIFSMEWKKIASMESGKIVFHSIKCRDDNTSQIKYTLQSKLACFFFTLNAISCLILIRDVEAEVGSGSWMRKQWKRLSFCGSGSTLMKETGGGSELGGD